VNANHAQSELLEFFQNAVRVASNGTQGRITTFVRGLIARTMLRAGQSRAIATLDARKSSTAWNCGAITLAA
jgi:hypothetical protein